MSNYDSWRLASPYDSGASMEEITDFYGCRPDEVTTEMIDSYSEYVIEAAALRYED